MRSTRITLLTMLMSFSLSMAGQQEGTLFFSAAEPMGNVAVSKNNEAGMQYFYTLHPESKPSYNKVFEIRNNMAYPFPDSSFQEQFTSPLGIYLDLQNRLWVLDHGNYGLKDPHLFAFDASNGQVLVSYPFPRDVARKWVMLNDLAVSPDGQFVFISAPGMFRKRSSIIVFDVSARSARRVLTDHPSVMRKKLLPVVDGKKMSFLLGMFKVRPGVDGIDADPRGRYVYYAAMADTLLYRIPVDVITDESLDDEAMAPMIQSVGERPLADGIRVDDKNLIYLTDFQNHRILSMDPYGELAVVMENDAIRWADGLSIGADGDLYITDSALQYVILKKPKKYASHQPFGIWRITIASP